MNNSVLAILSELPLYTLRRINVKKAVKQNPNICPLAQAVDRKVHDGFEFIEGLYDDIYGEDGAAFDALQELSDEEYDTLQDKADTFIAWWDNTSRTPSMTERRAAVQTEINRLLSEHSE